MSVFTAHFLPSYSYNALASYKDNADVTKTYAKDLNDIRALMTQHGVAHLVSVQVIYKKFQINEGEVMLCNKQSRLQVGANLDMKAIVPSRDTVLYGATHFVTNTGLLQAYEYTTGPVSDLRYHTPFLKAFCNLIRARGLQGKIGLRLWGGDGPDDFLSLPDSQVPHKWIISQFSESEVMAWGKTNSSASSKSAEAGAPSVKRLVYRCKGSRKFGDETWVGENWDKECDHRDCAIELVPTEDYEGELGADMQALIKSFVERG